MSSQNILSKWIALAPYFKSILRMVGALMFMMTGTMILFAFPVGTPGGGTVELLSQTGIGGMIQFVGGGLLLIGLCTRPVAFVLAGEMAVAYFQFHYPQGFWPIVNGGTNAVLYSFLWLYYSAAGAGVWSIDSLISKRK